MSEKPDIDREIAQSILWLQSQPVPAFDLKKVLEAAVPSLRGKVDCMDGMSETERLLFGGEILLAKA